MHRVPAAAPLKRIIFFPQNLHEESVWFPTEGNAFVLAHQHGQSEVSRKQALLKLMLIYNSGFLH